MPRFRIGLTVSETVQQICLMKTRQEAVHGTKHVALMVGHNLVNRCIPLLGNLGEVDRNAVEDLAPKVGKACQQRDEMHEVGVWRRGLVGHDSSEHGVGDVSQNCDAVSHLRVTLCVTSDTSVPARGIVTCRA